MSNKLQRKPRPEQPPAVRSSDLLERDFVIQCVMEEEELDGPMPDSIWAMLQTREAATEVLRANVRAIKVNIVQRLMRSNAPAHRPAREGLKP